MVLFELGYPLPAVFRVVCPTSLVGQWASEIKKYCIGLRTVEHVGTGRTLSERASAHCDTHYSMKLHLGSAELARAHVVVSGQMKGLHY